MALTATATPRVEEEIKTNLCLRNPFVAKTSFNRPNLHYMVSGEETASTLPSSCRKEHERVHFFPLCAFQVHCCVVPIFYYLDY